MLMLWMIEIIKNGNWNQYLLFIIIGAFCAMISAGCSAGMVILHFWKK